MTTIHPFIQNLIDTQNKKATSKRSSDAVRTEYLVAHMLNEKYIVNDPSNRPDTNRVLAIGSCSNAHYVGFCLLLTDDYFELKYNKKAVRYDASTKSSRMDPEAYKLQTSYGDIVPVEVFKHPTLERYFYKLKPHGQGIEVKNVSRAGTRDEVYSGKAEYTTIPVEHKQYNSTTGASRHGWLHTYTNVKSIAFVTNSTVIVARYAELRNLINSGNYQLSEKLGGAAHATNDRNVYDQVQNYKLPTDDLSNANGTLSFDLPSNFSFKTK